MSEVIWTEKRQGACTDCRRPMSMIFEGSIKHIVPMVRTPPQTIQSFVEEPVFVFEVAGVTGRMTNNIFSVLGETAWQNAFLQSPCCKIHFCVTTMEHRRCINTEGLVHTYVIWICSSLLICQEQQS